MPGAASGGTSGSCRRLTIAEEGLARGRGSGPQTTSAQTISGSSVELAPESPAVADSLTGPRRKLDSVTVQCEPLS